MLTETCNRSGCNFFNAWQMGARVSTEKGTLTCSFQSSADCPISVVPRQLVSKSSREIMKIGMEDITSGVLTRNRNRVRMGEALLRQGKKELIELAAMQANYANMEEIKRGIVAESVEMSLKIRYP